MDRVRWTISIGQIKWKYSDQSHFPKVVPKTKAGWDHLAGNRSRGAPKSIIRARPCDDLWCLPARPDWLIVGDCGGKGVSQRWSCHPESASASTSGCQDPSFRLVPFHVCFQVHQKIIIGWEMVHHSSRRLHYDCVSEFAFGGIRSDGCFYLTNLFY